MTLLLFALVALTLVFVALIAADLRSARRVPILTPTPDHHALPQALTVIIPARNEEGRIGRCLAGLAAQQVPDLDVLVLNDGSTDRTSNVIKSFCAQLPHLHEVAGEPLPRGWAGKCWACWQAAQHSNAEWLLFLDADTAPQPGMVAALLRYAVTNRIDLLTLLPLTELGSFWERVIMPPFAGLIQAVFPLDQVNDPRSSLAMANGQCILIRRAVYFAVDGHRAVRNSVLEDVRLAQTVKQAGYRLCVAGGPTLLRVRMYTKLSEVAEGLRKNAIAGYRAGGTLRSGWGGTRQALLSFTPITLIAVGALLALLGRPEAALVVGFGLLLLLTTLIFWGYVVKQLHNLHPLWAVLYPFGTLCYFTLAALAFLSIVRGRGVTWKDRTYSG